MFIIIINHKETLTIFPFEIDNVISNVKLFTYFDIDNS